MNTSSTVKYGRTHGELKPLDQVLLPDPRFQFLVITSNDSQRPFEQADLHKRLSDTEINSTAPEKVRLQFETARNLMLYSWFVFEFHTVAEMQGYAALELALGEKLGFPKRQIRTKKGMKSMPLMLADLLRKAVKEKKIIGEKLPAWERVKSYRRWEEKRTGKKLNDNLSAEKWLNQVVEIISRWRNGLAHGEARLYLEASFFQLELCGDLINALFPKASSK